MCVGTAGKIWFRCSTLCFFVHPSCARRRTLLKLGSCLMPTGADQVRTSPKNKILHADSLPTETKGFAACATLNL